MNDCEIKEFLDRKVEMYNSPEFIASDPIAVPHSFTHKADREIAGFLTATISWGNRKAILKSGFQLMNLMDNAPQDFILNFEKSDLKIFEHFKYRTFQPDDIKYFIQQMHFIYKNYKDLESFFVQDPQLSTKEIISNFRTNFIENNPQQRTLKHLANPKQGSAAKRINMFLRWMVRKDKHGVDFGIWKSIKPNSLIIPLDVHSASSARKLGLLTRKSNDWKAADELTEKLKTFDAEDPIKYDYALFGLGVFEKF